MNGVFNRIDANMLYLLQQGIPEWKSSVLYPIDAVIKYQSTLYIATAENEDANPAANMAKWKKIFDDIPDGTTTQKGIVQSSSAIDSNSALTVATSKAVKLVTDLIINKDTIKLSSDLDSMSEITAATSKAIKSVNDKISPLSERISVDPYNVAGTISMSSPSNRYLFQVKNDGYCGVWDTQLSKWTYVFDPNGYLSAGSVPSKNAQYWYLDGSAASPRVISIGDSLVFSNPY